MCPFTGVGAYWSVEVVNSRAIHLIASAIPLSQRFFAVLAKSKLRLREAQWRSKWLLGNKTGGEMRELNFCVTGNCNIYKR